MHRLIPDLIIENYRTGRLRGSLQAASLFLDISGFSVMTDALMGQGRDGAEALATTMRAVFDPMAAAIFAQGGWIVGYAGDSVSALFPETEGDAPAARRALAAAISIQKDIGNGHPVATPFGTFSISARIGIARGEVTWGILPAKADRQAVYYFRGVAVDEAARAEHNAAHGEILLTGSVREGIDPDASTEPIGDLHALRRPPGSLPSPRPIALPPIDVEASSAFVGPDLVTRDLPGEFRQTIHLAIQLPEPTDSQLTELIEGYFELQAQYGGLLDRIDFGDKGCNMVVFWGAPTAHENDIDRALNLVLDLRRRLPFSITAGLTYYTSYAGYIGARMFEAYAAYGWGVSMAARFMTEAAAGEIWLDERISARVQDRFEIDLEGERAFKGFAQRQRVYRLLGRKPAAGSRFRGRMVGRLAELEALGEFVAPLWSGKYAGVLGIWGEAGVGKSRLVHEFRTSALFDEHACLWASCRTDEILRRSLNPFRSWLSEYFALKPGQSAAAQLDSLKRKLGELIASAASQAAAADLQRAPAFLAPLVGLEWPDGRIEHLDAQARYDNTINALIALLKAESRRQPVILLVEDAHHLDEDSKAFIPLLKRAFAADPLAQPLAIIMTTRWEGTSKILEEGLFDQDLDLRGRGDEPVAQMSVDILGGPAAPRLIQLVNQRAAGNPFYIEQILHFLKENERLELDADGQWTVRADLPASALPADISAMLVARLDKLPDRVRQVIQAAAIQGRAFDLPVVQRMLGPSSTWEREVAAAERAAVWYPLSETRYMFDHELLRDAAYHMQLHSRRRELHGLAFEALRDLFEHEPHRHYGALAFHSEQADRPDEARRHLTLAADAARDGFHVAQALDFYKRALAVRPNVDLEDDYRLRLERDRLLADHGSLDERLQELEALQALADRIGEPGRLAEVMLIRSRVMASRGYFDRSEEAARRTEELAGRGGRRDVAIGARIAMLDASYGRGRYHDAVLHGEAALELARAEAATEAEATILNKLGMAYLEMKNPSAARAYFEQSLAQFRSSDNVRGVARVLTNLGSVAGLNGNYSAALDYYEQALRLAREFGSRRGECILLGNTAWLSGLLGEFDRADTYARQGLQIARELGDRITETFCLIHLSAQADATGRHAEAIELAEKALVLSRYADNKNLQAWALTYEGHAYAASGQADEARRVYREALEIRQSLEQSALAAEPASALARLEVEGGELALATQHLEGILTELEQDGTLEGTDHPLRVYLNCYQVLQAIGDPRARTILNTARDMLRMRASGIADPSRRRDYLEKIPYNREILALWETVRKDRAAKSSPPADRPS